MKRHPTEVRAAASINTIISFDRGASAACSERRGQVSVAGALRERSADLLAETVRLQALLDEVLPALSHSSRFLGERATENVPGNESAQSQGQDL